MGLFDDLLGTSSKQTTPPTSTPIVNPELIMTENQPSIDPMQVMNAQTTSTPPNLDEILGISAGDITPEMPSYTARKNAGEEVKITSVESTENSPIIISETPQEIPTIVETPIISEAPMAKMEEITITNTPTTTPPETNAPIISIQEETPIISEAQKDTAEVLNTTVATPLLMEEKAETPSLFTLSETFTENITNPTSLEEKTTQTGISENISTETNASLFGNMEQNTETTISDASTTSLSSTADFITMSLTELDKMEKSLLAKKQSFEAEAEKYRQEKEKFAELEAEAIKNSHSMDAEQTRIETLRKYFQKQQNGASIDDSVSTALTGISVQNAVGNTMKTKTSRSRKNILA